MLALDDFKGLALLALNGLMMEDTWLKKLERIMSCCAFLGLADNAISNVGIESADLLFRSLNLKKVDLKGNLYDERGKGHLRGWGWQEQEAGVWVKAE